MTKESNHNIFRTKDLNEATYLYVSNKKLLDIEKDNGFCWFIFEDNEGCRALLDTYWRNEALVSAKTFAEALKSLKYRVINVKKEGRA